ncbi:MAG: SUMF1/EgtB/PvdO family nonheme iron enzyme [Anaerolinea sp.]|nr:SUMF1/EgtB/PvdO family nonheme iron enzyme [Anaerolinea sp.]
MKRHFYALLLAGTLLAACAAETVAPTPAPSPTPLASNADWTPVTQTFDGIDMVLVPAGCFTMGHQDGRRDERPEHEICLSSFWIDQTEITNGQFGSHGNFEGDALPRENLTWFEARDFCAARGERLPTEAEWEYAARGVDNLIYPWGNENDESRLIFDKNFENQTWHVGTHPEGASWVGALDMSGSVNEWTSSIYRPYPYDPNDGREDGDDTTSQRVYRSGWNSYIDYGTSAPIRFRTTPDSRDWFIGFRCVRDA